MIIISINSKIASTNAHINILQMVRDSQHLGHVPLAPVVLAAFGLYTSTVFVLHLLPLMP